MAVKGFININKPINMTSSDVVVKVRGILRKALGERLKVGHLGTLDPLGSGVLPIAIGTATRLFDYFIDKVKVYKTTFKFGVETDTLDRAGKVCRTCDMVPAKQQITAVLSEFEGEQDQIPPQYSAKSVNGVRAYDLARAGIEVELKPKRINVYSIKLLEDNDGEVDLQNGKYRLETAEYAFEIACSGGTYIRSIARDLAKRLSSCAYMSSIHRIRSGNFEITDAVSLSDFEQDPLSYIQPIDAVLKDMCVFELPTECAKHALNGIDLHFDDLPDTPFAVKYYGDIVGIAENIKGAMHLKTRL